MGVLHARVARLVLCLFAAVWAYAGPVHGQAVVASVPVAGHALAVNPVTHRIYVVNSAANTLTVVDGNTLASTTVAVGRNPQFVAVNTVANKIYVSNTGDASLTILDGASLTQVTLPINGAGPIVVNESINRIYVLRLGNNGEVSIVDGNSLTWYAIDTGSHTPAGLALNTATNRLYVSHNLSGDVRAIDITSSSDHPPNVAIQIAGHPTAIALNANTNRIYVLSNDARGPIVAIDGATNVAQRITAPGHAIGPRAVAVNPTSNKVYAGFSNEVVIVDGSTHALAYVPTGAVLAIAVNPNNNKAYVLDADRNLTVIDGNTNGAVTVPLFTESSSVAVNIATGRAYVSGSTLKVVDGGATQSVPAINAHGLWWGSNGTESGWGLNVTHQGDTLFATWFTYDAQGQGLWLVMSNGTRTGTNTYEGALYRTTGPAFSAAAFDPSRVVRTQVGTATLTFTDADNGTLAATVDGMQVRKAISRQVYAAPVPSCTLGGSAGASLNYQDLWWKSPAGSESGWGVNITHQGDILFVTWFTYDGDGRGMWLVGSSIAKTGNASFGGTLYRTVGPPLASIPWDSSRVVRTPVGSIDFAFADANTGTMTYTVNGISQSKLLTRQVFASPVSLCR